IIPYIPNLKPSPLFQLHPTLNITNIVIICRKSSHHKNANISPRLSQLWIQLFQTFLSNGSVKVGLIHKVLAPERQANRSFIEFPTNKISCGEIFNSSAICEI